MNQFGKVLLLTLGFGVLAVVLGFVTSGQVVAQGPPGGLDVRVVNTPLPVTGTVGISGTLPVTGTVGISGTPNVLVTNPASSPVLVRDIENPAREAFQASTSCSIPANDDFCSAPITVPSNKRLVIETVTFDAKAPPGQKVLVRILLPGTTDLRQFFRLAATPQGTFAGLDVFVGTHSLRLYADSGVVSLALNRNDTAGSAFLDARISGHLVDCGAGSGCPLP